MNAKQRRNYIRSVLTKEQIRDIKICNNIKSLSLDKENSTDRELIFNIEMIVKTPEHTMILKG